MIKRKEIDLAKSVELMARLDEVPDPVLSARQFIAAHFEELQRSGKDLKALHNFFINNGVEVGGFTYFCRLYNHEKRVREPVGE